MITENVTFYIAFTAGLLSFVSPCVLPLIPSYISYLTGLSYDEIVSQQERSALTKKIVPNSLWFILGFSLVFIALGTAFTLLGRYFIAHQNVIRMTGAIFIIIMGLHIANILPLGFLLRDKRLASVLGKKAGYLGSFIVGVGFAAGWTPCIGPILASILFVAGTEESLERGILLLVIYSLGFATPFLLTSLFLHRFLHQYGWVKKHMRYISLISGLFLILLGVMILTNYFAVFTSFLNTLFPFLIMN